ncbi:MAG: hypothetical protein N2Z80_02060 [Hydrogenothermaceae bacterium]|nr:hypothetical protein [Hydrogenothermaceae bacterium]
MLESYLSFTKEYGNYNFLILSSSELENHKKLYLSRNFIEETKDDNLYRLLASGALKVHTLYTPLDQVQDLYRDNLILVLGGVRSYDVLNNSPEFVDFIRLSGSKYIDILCYGNAYVAVLKGGKLLYEESSNTFLDRVLEIEGKIVEIRVPGASCGDPKTGKIDSYPPFVSLSRNSDFLLTSGLNVFVLDEDFKVLKFLRFSKSPYDDREIFYIDKSLN